MGGKPFALCLFCASQHILHSVFRSPLENAFSIPEPKKPPVFDQHLTPVTATEGDFVQLCCHVQGSEPIRIQWVKAGREIKPSDRCSFSFASGRAVLELKETGKADSGDYVCKASNVAGSDTSKCKVTIKGTDTKKPAHGGWLEISYMKVELVELHTSAICPLSSVALFWWKYPVSGDHVDTKYFQLPRVHWPVSWASHSRVTRIYSV